MMELTNITLNKPIKPYINADGWYAQCERCLTEINPENNICPKCGQAQDWTWLTNK